MLLLQVNLGWLDCSLPLLLLLLLLLLVPLDRHEGLHWTVVVVVVVTVNVLVSVLVVVFVVVVFLRGVDGSISNIVYTVIPGSRWPGAR